MDEEYNEEEYRDDELVFGEDVPDEEELEDFDESQFEEADMDESAFQAEEEFEHAEGEISMLGERVFADSKTTSRVGLARDADIEETFGLEIGGGKLSKIQEKISRQSRTPDDIYREIAHNIVSKYNLPKTLETDSIRVLQEINRQNKKLRFKSPAAIIFALQTFDDDKNISKDKIHRVFQDQASKEYMDISDLLRYSFFVGKLMYWK